LNFLERAIKLVLKGCQSAIDGLHILHLLSTRVILEAGKLGTSELAILACVSHGGH
jgi:hypothetical protein